MADYLDRLKDLNLRPNKIKIKENKEQILMEVDIPDPEDIIKELFIQHGEIEGMPKGARRDMTIARIGMIAELDASNLYERLAELTSDKLLKKALLDISNEEKVHAGEFEAILEKIDPEYEKLEEEGEKEVEDM